MSEVQAAARTLGLEVVTLDIRRAEDSVTAVWGLGTGLEHENCNQMILPCVSSEV